MLRSRGAHYHHRCAVRVGCAVQQVPVKGGRGRAPTVYEPPRIRGPAAFVQVIDGVGDEESRFAAQIRWARVQREETIIIGREADLGAVRAPKRIYVPAAAKSEPGGRTLFKVVDSDVLRLASYLPLERHPSTIRGEGRGFKQPSERRI